MSARKIDSAALATQLRKDAERYTRTYKDTDGDAEFAATIKHDVAALNRVADKLETGDVKGAYRIAARLDTVVRDGISDRVWNAMSGSAAFGHTEHDQ